MAERLPRPGRLAPERVYRLAGALGAELQRLSGRFGPEAVAGLVPQVVRLLELLEALAGPTAAEPGPEPGWQDPTEALLRTVQSLRRREEPAAPAGEALEQKLAEAWRKEHVLQHRLAHLEEENHKLLAQLAESQSQEDSTFRKEREVMLRLKEVVDKQRDEIRAQAHEIVRKNHDTEALQEQLNRFMSMNEDLRHKLAVVQAQLKSALEKKEDLETMVLENRREIDRLTRTASAASPGLSTDGAASPGEELQHPDWGRNSAQSCFSKEELQQILQERNELKTSLFLVQEELAYYQRELLNEERIPGLLLDAMKSTIKKQRKKIRAKMLGTVEEPASSDEDETSWLPAPTADCVDSQLRESKIKSLKKQGGNEAKERVRQKRRGRRTDRTNRQTFWPWTGSCAQELDPSGRNVCKATSLSADLACCPGWKQEGRECTAALCEGEDACKVDEVCVRPGICRCKPGFFGAHCSSRCPDQYWGSDCKESCACHPHGKCDPVSGQCSCNPNRWGELCQFPCQCGPHGLCNTLTGACHCEPGWWAPNCKKQCQCNLAGSLCDPVSGQCVCAQGWWGRRCSFRCDCHRSPCAQDSGRCECRAGFWGPLCQRHCDCLHGNCNPHDGRCSCSPGYQGRSCGDPCPAGYYGSQCSYSCGHCKQSQPCSPVDGFCLACEAGWNGTRCDQQCPPGYHGENCAQVCPSCRKGEACNPETGACLSCDPGKTGSSCEAPCPASTFGDGCRFPCPDCVNGSCNPVFGECLCQAGYWGTSCNETCPEGFFGANCSSPCRCAGGLCRPHSGDCVLRSRQQGALIAGILIPLLLLLLCITCCCCCGTSQLDARDRSAAADGDAVSRMKHHVQGVLANLSFLLPCLSLRGYKLPRVTVSHHDTEIPFNPSFIEPPSAAWASDSSFSSSFDTDDEGPAYCVPTREDAPAAASFELQEGNSKCPEFPDASAFNSEDVSQPFTIPRTSSIARAKRPSVSFAEGTKFGPQSRRGSVETPTTTRKPKAPWGVTKLPSHQPQADPEEGPEQGGSPGDIYENPERISEAEESHRPSPRAAPGGRRKAASSGRHVAQRVEALEAALNPNALEVKQNVTTIYVTVGTAGRASKPNESANGSREGPVQAVLKRLGSFQRVKGAFREDPPVRKSTESIQKPPRRALGLERDSRDVLPQLASPHKESCKTTGSEPSEAPELLTGRHPIEAPERRQPLIPTSPLCKRLVAPGEELTGDPKESDSPEEARSLETNEQAAVEEEPKYENVSPNHCPLSGSPATSPGCEAST